VFSDDDIQFIATFADQAAVAIEEAQLVAAVVREKSRIEAIVQHSVDGILATDTSLRITDANRALETMLGIPRTDMLGAPCREVLQCTDEAGASMCTDQCPLDRALRSGQPVRVEMHIRTRNGRLLDIGMSCGLVQDEHGEPSQIVAVVRDVSQEKQIERLRSDFVSTVSHELRTPLALIKGYVATLLRRDVPLSPEAQERFLLRINEAADRLGRLIDNVLSASRIEAGRFVLRCHPFDLADLVEKVASSMQPFDQSHRIVVQAPLPLDGSRTARQGLIVHADQDKIEQVLINLISNAMKYSPAGTAITIAVRRLTQTSDVDLLRQQVPTTPAGCSVPAALVSVSDQGPGIPLEHQEHLFEKFYRVEGGLGRRASGSGLGLYICRTIVEAHGGCIWVRSAPDTGSTFFFTIPLPSE
jgi:PAS domain S-box-containing protein